MMDFKTLQQDELHTLAEKAYVYGFPLVFSIQQIERYLKTGMTGTPAPLNTLSHADHLANADDTFVSVNNDTLYSWAGIDLSVGPLILKVPNTKGRYYVGQFIDVWTNNFAYIGQRATGTEEQTFYLVPPNFNGEVPKGMTVIEFPTTVGVIIFRWAITGNEELPIIKEIQNKTELVKVYPENKEKGIPKIADGIPSELNFFESMRIYLNEYPASFSDQIEIESHFERLGLSSKNTSVKQIKSNEVINVLKQVGANGTELLYKIIKEKNSNLNNINGWDLSLHMFDYNDSFFEIGTVKSKEWIIQNRSEAIVQRAISAITGLWGNNSYEAIYPSIWVDSNNEKLDGNNTYEVTFQPVPTDGFWSLTMYDVPNFYLVNNPIQRYSLGDRTKGIIYNEDGSLTITISSTEPLDKKRRANWLPAPLGEFRPMLRVYQPREALLNQEYQLPKITLI